MRPLRFALAPGPTPYAGLLPDALPGAQAEISEAGPTLAAAIGKFGYVPVAASVNGPLGLVELLWSVIRSDSFVRRLPV